ncbi:hypothetical protein ACFQV2_17970 [Actinokineospora soli]|uniref:ABC transmembrane type-1 domain-containing protein n=1 Tax=Actinokineospora soli TaxID=1048753 RepID=A0ABW2TPE3_9PSEU
MAKPALRAVVVVYLALLVIWPVGLVAYNTFADGTEALETALTDPVVLNALWLTAQVAFTAVIINTVFGVGVSILLVRHRFPGRRLLSLLLDLPLSVSPVVVGLAIVLVYGEWTAGSGRRWRPPGSRSCSPCRAWCWPPCSSRCRW